MDKIMALTEQISRSTVQIMVPAEVYERKCKDIEVGDKVLIEKLMNTGEMMRMSLKSTVVLADSTKKRQIKQTDK